MRGGGEKWEGSNLMRGGGREMGRIKSNEGGGGREMGRIKSNEGGGEKWEG